jgi:very-short-patch-repair endonuclease
MAEEREEMPRMRAHLHGGAVEPTIGALAARQHGVVARRQLEAAGVSRAQIERRSASGRLLRLHRGVYAVGHARLRREGVWMAAVLAAGDGALLSHRDAAALHGLLPPHTGLVEVTTADQRVVHGVRVHGRTRIGRADATSVDRIPVTTVARTLVDLAGVVPARRLAAALDEADRSGRFDLSAIEAALARTAGRRGDGHRALRAALRQHARAGAQLLRSELEERFAALVAMHGLPRPTTNALIEHVEVDVLWPVQRVVVELDGWAFHHTRAQLARDRAKANRLQALGYAVYRYGHHDLLDAPERIARELRAALARRDGEPARGPARRR